MSFLAFFFYFVKKPNVKNVIAVYHYKLLDDLSKGITVFYQTYCLTCTTFIDVYLIYFKSIFLHVFSNESNLFHNALRLAVNSA